MDGYFGLFMQQFKIDRNWPFKERNGRIQFYSGCIVTYNSRRNFEIFSRVGNVGRSTVR